MSSPAFCHVPFDSSMQNFAPNNAPLALGRDASSDLYLYQERQAIDVVVSSFSFKMGPPCAATLVVDVRFLPDPRSLEDVYPHITGRHPAVEDFITCGDEFGPFFQELTRNVTGMVQSGMAQSTSPRSPNRVHIAVGCTAGRHRSVFVAEKLSSWLLCNADVASTNVRVCHRDLVDAGGKATCAGLDMRACDQMTGEFDDDNTVFDMEVEMGCGGATSISCSVTTESTLQAGLSDDDHESLSPVPSDAKSCSPSLDDLTHLQSAPVPITYCAETRSLMSSDRVLSRSCNNVLGSVLGNGLSKLKNLREKRATGSQEAMSRSCSWGQFQEPTPF